MPAVVCVVGWQLGQKANRGERICKMLQTTYTNPVKQMALDTQSQAALMCGFSEKHLFALCSVALAAYWIEGTGFLLD